VLPLKEEERGSEKHATTWWSSSAFDSRRSSGQLMQWTACLVMKTQKPFEFAGGDTRRCETRGGVALHRRWSLSSRYEGLDIVGGRVDFTGCVVMDW